MSQTWYLSQKYKNSKYKNPKYEFSYLKSGVSFLFFIEIRNYSVLLQNYFNNNTWMIN